MNTSLQIERDTEAPDPKHPFADIEAIPIDRVEDRVLRAMKTIRALPDKDKRHFKHKNGWPAIVQDARDAYGDHERPRFSPNPFDVSDVLTALSWANVLEQNEYRIVWARSFGFSFKQIGIRIGRSDETARRRYRDAILLVWGAANGMNVDKPKSG